MSGAVKQQCVGMVWHLYSESRCRSHGRHEHEGKWYCKLHHPPTVAAKDAERRKKWDDEWAVKERGWAETKLATRALAYMRLHHPERVKELEEEGNG